MAKKKAVSKDTSWRNIKQTAPSRAVTKAARQRRLNINLKYCAYGAALLALVAFVGAGVWWWQNRAFGALAVPEEKLKQVYFQTDGVLTESWLKDFVALPENVGLMDVNITALRDEILTFGQIRQAEVERIFPDSLKISIAERRPILRIVTMDATGKRFAYMVSEEGEVFKGQNYPREMRRHLPFLDGVVLKRSGTGFERIPQAPVLAELLETVRTGWPELYADWRIVSCRSFSGATEELGALILVNSQRHGEIIFQPKEFAQQLARLEEITNYAERERIDHLAQVDLSLKHPSVRLAASEGRRGPHASR